MLTHTLFTVTMLSLATPSSATADTSDKHGTERPAHAAPHQPLAGPIPYEVNTHQLFALLAARRSQNLARFLQDFGLEKTRYTRRYPDAAQDQSKLISIANSMARDLIGAGAVLEDGGARFFNHFHDPVNQRGLNLPVVPAFPMARDWARDGAQFGNSFDMESALDYYRDSLIAETPALRRDAQENLFVTLGHLTHLIHDCLQPSHSRNDSHSGQRIPVLVNGTVRFVEPDGHSALEHYGRDFVHSGGIPSSVASAIVAQDSIYLPSFDAYYDEAAAFSNEFFFSDDTIFSEYALPNESTTSTRVDSVAGRPVSFVVSRSLRDPRSQTAQRLARQNRGLFWDSFSLDAPANAVLLDNMEALAPRAVALSEGLIDHLLRGRLQLTLDPATRTRIVVENLSSARGSSGGADMTMAGGFFRLFYEAVSGRMVELPAPLSPQSFGGSLGPRQQVELTGDVVAYLNDRSAASLPDDQRAREDRRMLVLFDGDIGSERGLAAARIAFSNDVSLLLSYDTSGSIGNTRLRQARDAGRELITLLSQGTDNRIELQAWSTTVHTRIPFTANLQSVDNALGRLVSSGGTALFRATVEAGDACLAEARRSVNTGDDQRVVMVLFTDGDETQFSATLEQASAAISRVGRPEIDEVFLVFVGGAGGLRTLRDMGALAGRPVFAIENFDDLTKAFQNLLQSAP